VAFGAVGPRQIGPPGSGIAILRPAVPISLPCSRVASLGQQPAHKARVAVDARPGVMPCGRIHRQPHPATTVLESAGEHLTLLDRNDVILLAVHEPDRHVAQATGGHRVAAAADGHHRREAPVRYTRSVSTRSSVASRSSSAANAGVDQISLSGTCGATRIDGKARRAASSGRTWRARAVKSSPRSPAPWNKISGQRSAPAA
jgi:hypothetical protein